MILEEMVSYVKTVQVMKLVGIQTTRHQLAKSTLLAKSRSTVYRDVNKLIDAGVVKLEYDKECDKEVVILTEKGLSLLDAYLELL